MILATAVMLTLVFGTGLIWSWRRFDGDLFAPATAISWMHFIRTVPYIYCVAFDEGLVHDLAANSVADLGPAFLWYGLLEIAGYLAFMAGVCSGSADRIGAFLPQLHYRLDGTRMIAAAAFGALLGGAAFFMFLHLNGGYVEVIYNLDQRTELTKGKGYLLSVIGVLNVSVVLIVYLQKFRPSPWNWINAALLFLFASFVFTVSIGGRKLTLAMVLSLLMTYHYGISRLKRPKTWQILLLGAAAVYFVVVPLARRYGAMEQYMNRPYELLADAVNEGGQQLSQLSYVDTYVFVCNHFDLDNIWMGRTFNDLLWGWIPRSFYPDKPPLDSGAYVYAMAAGKEVLPGTPSDQLLAVSWPPETLGTGYLNFWIPGVIGFSMALGVVLQAVYRWAQLSGFSLFSILIMQSFLFNFHITNLRIVQNAIGAIILILFFFTVFSGSFKAKKSI